MLLMIDNYDSFTFNLVDYFRRLGQEVVVKRNDEVCIQQIRALRPDYIVISPGPCTPLEAGISIEVVETFYDQVPILGVCLGHQVIAHVFGKDVVKSPKVMHGKVSAIEHNDVGVFKGVPCPVEVTRYHSLTVSPDDLNDQFEVTAWLNSVDKDGFKRCEVMAMRHRKFALESVQFHPESILTQNGLDMLNNFIEQNAQS